MGASVFYSEPPTSETQTGAGAVSLEDEISKLDAEIKVSFPFQFVTYLSLPPLYLLIFKKI